MRCEWDHDDDEKGGGLMMMMTFHREGDERVQMNCRVPIPDRYRGPRGYEEEKEGKEEEVTEGKGKDNDLMTSSPASYQWMERELW